MAALTNGSVRLRLLFDYPPPAAAGCRMCWLLVDLNACRVVADLESVIREKFEFSRGSILYLFIEDCYLPHTESVHVVRDNDSVRVRVDTPAQINGHSTTPDSASDKHRKRKRAIEEGRAGENGVNVEWKKKKRKKRREESTEGTKQALNDDGIKKLHEKHTKKKKKKKKVAKTCSTATPKPAASSNITPASVDQKTKSTKKPSVTQTKTQNTSSSSSSSSSEEDDAPKKTATRTPTSTPATSKAPPNSKPAQSKSHLPSSSSSDTDSSSDEAAGAEHKLLTPMTSSSKSPQTPPVPQSINCAPKRAADIAAPPHDNTVQSRDSESEEEIQLVIRQPLQLPSCGRGAPSFGRGRSRGKVGRGFGSGERDGGRGAIRGRSGNCESRSSEAKQPSYETDSLTNMSVVLQNGAESAPKQDYGSMPLLAAPPQVGQKIAFKLLELTENYTPEVSEYKEGKIMSFDPTTKQIELELLTSSQAPVEPGKFDLVYQNPDGSERVEYAVSRGSRVTERWESLLEPRLII